VIRVLFVLLAAVLLAAPGAEACSCAPPEPPMEALQRADAVFVGVAGEARGTVRGESQVTRFDVLGGWKGVSSPEILVGTRGGPGDCGSHFVLGSVYLVYAFRMGPGDSLRTSRCTRTVPLADATADLAALPRPTVVSVDPAQWADRAVPEPCPVHPSFQVRHGSAWILTAPERAWDEAAYEAAQAGFPYGALDILPLPDPQVPGPSRYLPYALVCAACREDAVAWSLAHGAVCLEIPSSGDADPALEEDTAAYRRRYPDRSFAFLFDDGRRYRVDTIDGWLQRFHGTVQDTMISFALAESTKRHLYELAIENRMFDQPLPHPASPRSGDSDAPACVRMELYIRSDSLVRQYEWNPAHVPRAATKTGRWERFHAFIEGVARAIEAHPAVRALPPLPVRETTR
jgi:hypothetical protein